MSHRDCIEEIIKVCNKHGVVLSHEDSQGGFLLLNKSEVEKEVNTRSGKPMLDVYHDWLREAAEGE